MDGGSFLIIGLDLAAHVAIVDFELPFQLLAAVMFVELTVSISPIVSFEEQVADHHAAKVRDICDPRLRACDGRQEGEAAHDEHHPFHLKRQQKVEIDDAVRIRHSIGQEKSVDGTGGTNDDSRVVYCHQPGADAGSDAGYEVIA